MTIDEQFLNYDRRRELILFYIAGIDGYQTFAGRKPEPAIGGFAPGRLHSAGTLKRWQALAFAVIEAIDPIGLAIGACVQLRFGDAHDAIVRTHPEVSAVIFFDVADDV